MEQEHELTAQLWQEHDDLLWQYLVAEAEWEVVAEEEYLQPVEVWEMAFQKHQRALNALKEFEDALGTAESII